MDFVDSLGRSRRCLKKDLTHYRSIDDHLVANRSNGIENKDRCVCVCACKLHACVCLCLCRMMNAVRGE